MRPVGEVEHAVGDRGGARLVRDHHDRLAELLDRVTQELEDLGARRRVEVAGRLVREDDVRLRDERTGDRDALLLATGELGGAVREAIAESDRGDQLVEVLVLGLLAGDRERAA